MNGDANKTYIQLDGTKPTPGLIAWSKDYSATQNFGVVGYQISRSWVLSNIGRGPVEGFSVTMKGYYPEAWTATHNCPTSISAGSSCSVTATFLGDKLPRGEYPAQVVATTSNGSGSLTLDTIGTCIPTYWASYDTIDANASYDYASNPGTTGSRCTTAPGLYSVREASTKTGTQHQHIRDGAIVCPRGFYGYSSTSIASGYIRDCYLGTFFKPRTKSQSANHACQVSKGESEMYLAFSTFGETCDTENVYITRTWVCK